MKVLLPIMCGSVFGLIVYSLIPSTNSCLGIWVGIACTVAVSFGLYYWSGIKDA
jgi:phosphotransferase system  glucose/maltose/N-acetylglucosamine-specific IIC component